jgi:hypothetical protein
VGNGEVEACRAENVGGKRAKAQKHFLFPRAPSHPTGSPARAARMSSPNTASRARPAKRGLQWDSWKERLLSRAEARVAESRAALVRAVRARGQGGAGDLLRQILSDEALMDDESGAGSAAAAAASSRTGQSSSSSSALPLGTDLSRGGGGRAGAGGAGPAAAPAAPSAFVDDDEDEDVEDGYGGGTSRFASMRAGGTRLIAPCPPPSSSPLLLSADERAEFMEDLLADPDTLAFLLRMEDTLKSDGGAWADDVSDRYEGDEEEEEDEDGDGAGAGVDHAGARRLRQLEEVEMRELEYYANRCAELESEAAALDDDEEEGEGEGGKGPPGMGGGWAGAGAGAPPPSHSTSPWSWR